MLVLAFYNDPYSSPEHAILFHVDHVKERRKSDEAGTSLAPVLAPSPVSPFAAVTQLVLDSVSSPLTRAMYEKALRDFFTWWEEQGRPGFTRATVQAHRSALEAKGYAASTINQRLAAIRKLALEAAENHLLELDHAAAIARVKGLPKSGTRMGNWLTEKQAEQLINAPTPETLKGKRDRALLALLVGCGLRRNELATLKIEDLQQREARWVIVDLHGKHGRVRSVPVPPWVKVAVDDWLAAAGFTTGRVFCAVSRHGKITSRTLSAQAVLDNVHQYGKQIGVENIRPHDLRRTCAKLCRNRGGELEQIQLLLGHSSIHITEQYLGTKQNLHDAPNDRFVLHWQKAS
jgi:integrase/recombinase XerD